jgi:hypothetical protein
LDWEYSLAEVLNSRHQGIEGEGECTNAEEGEGIGPDDASEVASDDFGEEV